MDEEDLSGVVGEGTVASSSLALRFNPRWSKELRARSSRLLSRFPLVETVLEAAAAILVRRPL